MIRVLIVDDHTVVREGLKQIFSGEEDIQVAAEACNGDEAITEVQKDHFDVVVLDISMPGKCGIEIIRQIKSIQPKSKILVLSIYPEEQYAVRVMKSGADGYLSKDCASSELISAVRQIFLKGKFISQSQAIQLAIEIDGGEEREPHRRLSNREFQVMLMIASGKTVGQIADELHLSVKTISTNRARILEKMKMKNNAELVQYAIRNNLVE